MPLDNITELKKRVPGGKYALARAVAERARQLQNGAMPLTEVKAPNPLSVAIDEIVQGKITFQMDTPDETDTAKSKSKSDGQPAAPATADSGGAATTVGADKAAAQSPVTGEIATNSSEEVSAPDEVAPKPKRVRKTAASTKTEADTQTAADTKTDADA